MTFGLDKIKVIADFDKSHCSRIRVGSRKPTGECREENGIVLNMGIKIKQGMRGSCTNLKNSSQFCRKLQPSSYTYSHLKQLHGDEKIHIPGGIPHTKEKSAPELKKHVYLGEDEDLMLDRSPGKHRGIS